MRRYVRKPSDPVAVVRPDVVTYCVRSEVEPEDLKYVVDEYSQA
jgi:hypothetical protein